MNRRLISILAISMVFTCGVVLKRGVPTDAAGTDPGPDTVQTGDLDSTNPAGSNLCVTVNAGDNDLFTFATCGTGTGDISAVGPNCNAGDCFVDGTVSTGPMSEVMLVFEGIGPADGNELRFLAQSSNPNADITFLDVDGNVVTTNQLNTVTNSMLATDYIEETELASEADLETFISEDVIIGTEINTAAGFITKMPDVTGSGNFVLMANAEIDTPVLTLELIPAATGEGLIHWDGGLDQIVMGTGGGTVNFFSGDHITDTSAASFVTTSSEATLGAERIATCGAGIVCPDTPGNPGSIDFATASTENGFLVDGAGTPLSCGAANNAGRMHVRNGGLLEWCDGDDALQNIAGLGADIDSTEMAAAHDFGEFTCDGGAQGCEINTAVVDSDNISNGSILGGVGGDIDSSTITRHNIDETQLSMQVSAAGCGVLVCDAASTGELCFQEDTNDFYICEGSTTTWHLTGMFGTTVGPNDLENSGYGELTFVSPNFTINSGVVDSDNIAVDTIINDDVAEDAIQLNELDDDANDPTAQAGNCLIVEAGGNTVDYADCNTGAPDDLARDGTEPMAGILDLNDTVDESPPLRLTPGAGVVWEIQAMHNTEATDPNDLRIETNSVTTEEVDIVNLDGTEVVNLNVEGAVVGQQRLVIGDGTGNDYLEAIEEATNPTCGVGDYRIWVNSVDGKWKKCEDGNPITDLDTGAGSVNSFVTHNTPLGTDPVAASATDTLNWAVGSNITITGDSGTDTITLDVPDIWVDVLGDTMTGVLTMENDIILDDGVTNTPLLQFIPADNEEWTFQALDTVGIFNIATSRAAGDATIVFNDSGGSEMHLNIEGNITDVDDITMASNGGGDPDSGTLNFDTNADTDWSIQALDSDGDLQILSASTGSVETIDISNPGGAGLIDLELDGALVLGRATCGVPPAAACGTGEPIIRIGETATESGWEITGTTQGGFEPDLSFRAPDNNRLTGAILRLIDTADGVGGEAAGAGQMFLTIDRFNNPRQWFWQTGNDSTGQGTNLVFQAGRDVGFFASDEILFLTGSGITDEVSIGQGTLNLFANAPDMAAAPDDAVMLLSPLTATQWTLTGVESDGDLRITANTTSTETIEIGSEGAAPGRVDLVMEDGLLRLFNDSTVNTLTGTDGDIGIDTDQDQIIYESNTTQYAIDPLYHVTQSLPSASAALYTNMPVLLAHQDLRVQEIACHCGNTTVLCGALHTVTFLDKDGNTIGVPTCTTENGALSFTDVSGDTDGIIPRGDFVKITVAGGVTQPYAVTVGYTIDPN